MKSKSYYSISDIRRMTGIPRYRISVLVDVLNLSTFRGPKNSKQVDDAGLKAIKRHAAIPEHRPERRAS